MKKQDKFPGIDEAITSLPHPGALFLHFFERFKRVELKPISASLESQEIRFAVYRNGARLFDPSCSFAPHISLSKLAANISEFLIRPEHAGLNFAQIETKRREFLKNRISDYLKERSFPLYISSAQIKQLSDEESYVSFFWDDARYANMVCMGKKEHIRVYAVETPSNGLSGIALDNGWSGPWEMFIPDENERRAMDVVVAWHLNWRGIKALSNNGVKVDLQATWEQCAKEIQTVSYQIEI